MFVVYLVDLLLFDVMFVVVSLGVFNLCCC